MQAGDTLQSIAQDVYGNGNLWYVIADANALTLDSSGTAVNLVAGTTLKLPAVRNEQNTSHTFTPYNPLQRIGSTTPALAYIPPAPQQHCKDLTTLIVVAVTVAVTAYSAGAFAEEAAQADAAALGGSAATATTASVSGIFQSGVAVLSGGTLGSSAALSTFASLSAAQIAGAAFVGGALGSAAGQVAANVTGQTDHFSFGQVLAGGLTSVAASGISNELGSVTRGLMASGQWGNAALSGVANGLASTAADRVVGVPAAFSWASVAASALAAGLGAKLDPTLDSTLNLPASSVMGDALNGFVSGVIDAQTQRALGQKPLLGFGQIAADAFGNALGDYVDGQDRSRVTFSGVASSPPPTKPQPCSGIFAHQASIQSTTCGSNCGT